MRIPILTHVKRYAVVSLAWITLVHAVVFVAYWLTNNLFYTSVNDYLSDLLNRTADYIGVC